MVAWSAVTLFLIEWGSVSVSNCSDTMFLKRVGVDWLPLVFLVNSVLLTATTFVAGRLAVRANQRVLLGITFASLTVVLLVMWTLVTTGAPGAATTLILASKQIEVIASLMFWVVVGGLMTGRQSKRLVALMTAGGTLGTIFGSFSSSTFGKYFGIPSLLLVSAVAFIAAAFATMPLGRSARRPRILRRAGGATIEAADPQSRLVVYWRESALFRVLVCTSFLAGVLGPVLYFEFSLAADMATRFPEGEQRLLSLYGLLRGWINVGVLLLQLVGSAALFRRVGVPMASVLSPAGYMLGLTAISAKFGLPTAMPAMVGTSVVDHTIYEPAQRILSALLPPRMRSSATGIVQGPAKRAGAALGSLLVLLIVTFLNPSHVAALAFPVAAAWTMMTWWLWVNYPNLLLDAASVRRSENGDGESLQALLDPTTLRTLQQNLEGEDVNLCRAACGLLSDAPSGIAIEALARAIARGTSQRPLLLEAFDRVLAGAGADVPQSGPAVASVVRILTDSSGLGPVDHGKLLQYLGRAQPYPRLVDAVRDRIQAARNSSAHAAAVRIAADVAAARLGFDNASMDAFDDTVAAALEGGDPECRVIALAELRYELMRGDDGDPTWLRRLDLLLANLTTSAPANPADPEREQNACGCPRAVEALADIAVTHQQAVAAKAQQALDLADDPDPSVRTAVLRLIGNAGLSDHALLLAQRLSSRVPVEAQAARRALETLGPVAVHAMLHALRHGGRRGRAVVPQMLKEIRPDGALLTMLIDREIDVCRGLLVVLGSLEANGISRLVLQRLRERIDESSRVVLELLAALRDDDRIASLCRSLGRAWNVRDRAVLLEALEALLPPAERNRILPLLEEHGVQRLATRAAEALGRRMPSLEEAVAQALASRDPLTTSLLAATINRGLLTSVAPALDVDAALRVFSPKRRVAVHHDAVVTEAPEEEIAEMPMLNPVETMLHLRALDLFEGLATVQLSELARVVSEVVVKDGVAIVTEGELDDNMYFIVEGNVHILRDAELVAELGPRDFFGEMAAFDGETRSATATAVGEVRLLSLARIDLFEVMEDQPAIGIGICQTLAKRLRNMLSERSHETPRGSSGAPGGYVEPPHEPAKTPPE
ncbi:MAG TPA: cyclic nucleotide-binding domain-containing protein [Candidatus Binatia bacterium]